MKDVERVNALNKMLLNANVVAYGAMVDLIKRTVDDFKGLERRIQSGKFRPNKKNKELWDKFIDYFDLKNVSIWER